MNDMLTQIRLLLIEDNDDHAVLIANYLKEAGYLAEHFICTPELASGCAALANTSVDVVLLDLNLPDSHGLESLARLLPHCPRVPVIVLTTHSDFAYGIKAIEEGAQDYLIKGQLTADGLARSIRYAIERKQSEIRQLNLSEALQVAIARSLVGQMLRDLQAVGHLSDGAMLRAGQRLAGHVEAATLPDYCETFTAMGLGTLSLTDTDAARTRWTFRGDKLMEVQSGGDKPTCHYTLGFLCGAISSVHEGAFVAGTELTCQAMGDASCCFVVQVVDPRDVDSP